METSREVEFKPKNPSWGDGDIAVVPKYTIRVFNIDANQRKNSFTCLENTVDSGRIRILWQLSVANRRGGGGHKTCYAIQR